ncbi:MAG: hypothetical protein ACTSPQ_04110 [Candidatus Helarchaeota archaeon]
MNYASPAADGISHTQVKATLCTICTNSVICAKKIKLNASLSARLILKMLAPLELWKNSDAPSLMNISWSKKLSKLKSPFLLYFLYLFCFPTSP